MGKITIDRKKDKIVITNRLLYPEALNERVFNAISSGMFEGLLPIEIIKKRKYTDLRCSITGLMSLNTYFSGVVSREMFLDVILQLIGLVKNCEKNMINPGNLDFQADRIFVDPHTKAVTCIYWPIVNNQNSVPAYLFLKQLPYEVVFDEREERGYIDEYLKFFEGINPFSINNFEKLILTLMGRQSSDTYSPSGQIRYSGEIKERTDTIPISASIEYDPFSQTSGSPETEMKKTDDEYLHCDNCGAKNHIGTNFCHKCGFMLKRETKTAEKEDCRKEIPEIEQDSNPDTYDATAVLGDGSGDTILLNYSSPKGPAYPYLIRERTGDKVYIDKPSFRIGKEKRYCDFSVSDNSAVSRKHADIITRGHRYFIIDLHSTNQTYVDGCAIPIDCEIEIFSKTKLRLADEDFTFYVE